MTVVFILLGQRMESAVRVQEILTSNSAVIRTRLGLNRELSTRDEASGFIFLEVCGDKTQIAALCDELNTLQDVKAECLTIELPGCAC